MYPNALGCGSAGAVVARRLAEDKNLKILILEAGKHGNNLLDIPSIGLLLQKTPFDWQYATTPQASSCFALNNKSSQWPMGKIVGGTGMLNNMIYVRGHPEDFRHWFGSNENYNFTTQILPYFEKLESQNFNDDTRSSVYLSDLVYTSTIPEFILNAARELDSGVSENILNCMQGFGLPKVNIKGGARWTASHRLIQLDQSNIFLRTNRVVEKILFHGNFEAYGVQYSHLGKSYRVTASKGVVLSAGVIGPRTHLEEINIVTKIDLPVGENLQDHVTTGFDLILLNQTINYGMRHMLNPYSLFEYFWSGTGPWTTPGCEVLAFFNTENKLNAVPDLQFMVMPLGTNEDDGLHIRHLLGISDSAWNNYFSLLNRTKAMTILPILTHPKSRGTVRLKDADSKSMPVIDPKYLSRKEDVEILLKGIELIKNLVKTEHMQTFGAKFNTNIFPGCESFEFDSKAYWECYVRHLTITSYHPVGTCKMGHEQDPTSVVDYSFKVKGTNNLYVVDASVIPTITSGNINAAVLMLAEMASDTIKSTHFFNDNKKCNIKDYFIPNYIC
ncbi:hypothetical protein NQ315_004469 [Exocentrus adspersus]|uniref:Glucose dehydrogenase n=1 Tax=Exocentrus adspersus TaxID=1586481 RepID=A0AAV8VPE1_9CUCU|nr:hypothetical protein NQ315_004469 [Exocentrus adspersus]